MEDDFDAAFASFADARDAQQAPAEQVASAEQAGDDSADAPQAKEQPSATDKGAPAGAEPAFAARDAEPLAEPPAADKPAAKPLALVDETGKARAPRLADLAALAPPEHAQAFKALIEATERDLQRLRSDDGRVSAYQHKYSEAMGRVEALNAELQALKATPPSAANAKKAEAAQEELDDIAREYPDLSDPLNMRIKRVLGEMLPAPKAETGQAPAAQPGTSAEPKAAEADEADVTALAREFAALKAAHPDYQQAVQDAAFHQWLRQQPPTVIDLANSTRAIDAIYVMDQFKRHTAQVQEQAKAEQRAQNRKRLETNVGVSGTPARVSTAPDDYEAAFGFFAAQRERAR